MVAKPPAPTHPAQRLPAPTRGDVSTGTSPGLVYAQALRVSLPYPQGTDWGSTRITRERSVDGDGPTRGPTKE